MDLLHAPVRADNDPQSHCALQLLQASCVGIVRVRVVDSSWHGHPASSRHGILAYRHALTGANAAATSLTNTATLSGTIGGLTEDAMEWISYGFVVRFNDRGNNALLHGQDRRAVQRLRCRGSDRLGMRLRQRAARWRQQAVRPTAS